MRFKFGSTTFRQNAAGISFDATSELDGAGVEWLRTQRWRIELRLIKETGGDTLDQQITQINNTISGVTNEAKLLHDDGTDTAHVMTAAVGLIGGVRVVKPPSYPRFQRGEHVTFRTAVFEIEGVFARFTSALDVIDLQETIQQVAAGPRLVTLDRNVGAAVQQTTRTMSRSRLVQSGIIRFAAAYGPIPGPKFGAGQLGPAEIRKIPPRVIGSGAVKATVGHALQYSYTFEAAASLSANPSTL